MIAAAGTLPGLARLGPGATSHGTFVKTDAVPIVEILALAGLDFVVVDAEHAPFDRGDIDRLVLAGAAWGLPVLVRVPDDASATLLSVLDVGAAGLQFGGAEGQGRSGGQDLEIGKSRQLVPWPSSAVNAYMEARSAEARLPSILR